MNQWCDAVAKIKKKKDFIQEYVGRHMVCQTMYNCAQ